MSKPREFWIIDNRSAYEEPQDMGYVRGEQIHVIEYTAYARDLRKLGEELDSYKSELLKACNEVNRLKEKLRCVHCYDFNEHEIRNERK